MSEWQPIETAPDDGTLVLVSSREGIWISARKKGRRTADGYGPFDGCDWYMGDSRSAAPTHWMPLPKPPETGDE